MEAFLQTLRNRTKNYAFWTSLFALIPLMVQVVGVVHLPDNYTTAVNAFLAFLVAAGVINNPTEGKWYLDNKEEKLQG